MGAATPKRAKLRFEVLRLSEADKNRSVFSRSKDQHEQFKDQQERYQNAED
jgi:hypothetical protein